MIGKVWIPNKVDEEGCELEKGHALIFEDDLILKRLGEKKIFPVEGSACD